VYKLSLSYRFFKAITGCPPDSSSSRTARQQTQRATPHSAQNWLRPVVQISSQKTNGLQIRRTQWLLRPQVGDFERIGPYTKKH